MTRVIPGEDLMANLVGDIQRRMREVQKTEDFTVTRSGSHIHVEKEGKLVAVVSSSPGDSNALRQVDRDLAKAGFMFDKPKRETHMTGEEGHLLYTLSNASRDLSSYSLSQMTGIPLGNVKGILTALKHPRLSFQNDLWHWDATDPATTTYDHSIISLELEKEIPLRDFNLPLRPDVVVKLTVPQDLTKAEKAQIMDWVQWIKAI
jgi:hypothetical protein